MVRSACISLGVDDPVPERRVLGGHDRSRGRLYGAFTTPLAILWRSAWQVIWRQPDADAS